MGRSARVPRGLTHFLQRAETTTIHRLAFPGHPARHGNEFDPQKRRLMSHSDRLMPWKCVEHEGQGTWPTARCSQDKHLSTIVSSIHPFFDRVTRPTGMTGSKERLSRSCTPRRTYRGGNLSPFIPIVQIAVTAAFVFPCATPARTASIWGRLFSP
jgi:hypothetical protein